MALPWPRDAPMTRRIPSEIELRKFNDAAFEYYPPLQRVRQFVEAQLPGQITLLEAARAAGLERTYFSTYFHLKVGISFTAWLTELRVRRAMESFLCRDDSVVDVALAVGFRDVRSFERAFRRCVAMTPGAFRRSVRP